MPLLENIVNHENYLKGGRRRALLLSALFAPAVMYGQSAVVGSLGNFDAANFEGKDAHGLEVQIEGILPGDLNPSWCGNKYSCPVIEPYATGVYVRYKSPYDAVNKVFTATTVPHTPGTAFGGTCYMGSATYPKAGCDHFGVHINYTAVSKATTTAYRWMFEDPNNPGQLIASTNNIFVPTPVYTWVPPATPTAPPTLVVEVQTPDPPPPPPALPPQYGDATWMKIYKTDLQREARLDELVTGNDAVVPNQPTQIETEWTLMQPAPPPSPGDNRKRRNRQRNQSNVDVTTRAVVRRYETYTYTGGYDPLTHEAVCGGDATCNVPQAGELGDMLTAQMAAANVAIPSLTVTIAGNGTVSSSDKVISCGSKCSSPYALGTEVTLTAKAGSNSTFTGWTGACSGTGLTCTVTISDIMTTTATFTANAGGGGGGGGGGSTTQYTLQVGRSNTGTVTSDVAGINCGSTCSAKFNSGAVVTLTATPPAGKTFTGWSGGCTGTAATCTVTMLKDTSVQAAFSK